MNKTSIKNFAIWARNKLIADIQYRAGLMGITTDGIKDPLPQSTGTMEFYDIGTSEPYAIIGDAIPQRKKLVEVIRRKEKDSNYATAYKYILEEVAYTWFNRLIAIRFMEVNDYLPSHIRVLSSESGKIEPDLVTTPFDAELIFTSAEEETVLRLKTENKLDELFRLLFIKQCNALNEILPALFEKTSDYTELLLNLSVVDQDGVVYHLTHDIPEQDFDITHPDENGEVKGQVEIIGWLYQYYNTEPKNAAFAKTGKITKEEIPAVTQLFTPDWIVRYMVENSLGRIFIDKKKEQGIYADGRSMVEMTWDEVEAKRIANEEDIAGQMGWKYYLPEAAQTKEVRQQLEEIQKQSEYKDVRDIKVIDPCMGSGHILVYAFDVLMKMYESDGYSQRDAAQCILEHNLFGLDIDDRAAQLAYFAVMMKARQYDRRIFSRGIQPHVYAIAESNGIDGYTRVYFMNNDPKLKAALDSIIHDLHDAKEYGSILTVAPVDFAALYARVDEIQNDISLHREAAMNTILPLIRVAEVLAQQYNVVVTNPPYIGSGGMSDILTQYLKIKYADVKNDLFSVCIKRMITFVSSNGYIAYIAPQSWMFLSTQEGLRNQLLNTLTLNNLLDLGTKAFDSGFGTATAVFSKKQTKSLKATCINLTTSDDKEALFLSEKTDRYECSSSTFEKLPGMIFSYSCTEKYSRWFAQQNIGNYATLDCGIKTGSNNTFVRLWYEVSVKKFAYRNADLADLESGQYKWFKYSQGGGFHRWYGAIENVVDLENNAANIRKSISKATYRLRDKTKYFFSGMVWPMVGTNNFSCRYLPRDVLPDIASNVIYCMNDYQWELLAYMNSKVFNKFIIMVNPTVNYPIDSVGAVPFKQPTISDLSIIKKVSQDNCEYGKNDWDSYETSWDFQRHPLLRPVTRLADAFTAWKTECEQRFLQLKTNEEELNCIFIDIYGLQDELPPEVADKDVTVHRVFDTKDDVPESMQGSSFVRTKRDEIVSLFSYAVGCMFGRYSLDVDGLAYAGGDWDADKYKTFLPDRDGILPITDEEYLEDDIISRLCDWLKAVYGADTLEENLDFIAGALGGKGNSSREIIRNYFLKDFFKDHCKTYQKRPIYWLFDSGKQNGFKALIYLHRYTPDTIGNLRVDYLHKMQRVYESEINRMQDMIDHSTNAREVAASTKRKEKLQKQLKECRDYDEMIAHLALSRIELDLDDGVKVNYEKIQTASDGKKYAVLAKI